jgi:hypothetical protein
VGLFGKTVYAELQDIRLENVHVKGKSYVGGLAGQAVGGSLSELSASGVVSGMGEYIGGLFGQVHETRIVNSSSAADVTGHRMAGGLAGDGKAEGGSASGRVQGMDKAGEQSYAVGGLLGMGYALNSHASGVVSGSDEVGGLIGRGSARGSHATGNVTATGDYVGGLIGYLVGFDRLEEDRPEYTPGEPAAFTTVEEIKTIQVQAATTASLMLSDASRVAVEALPVGYTLSLARASNDIQLSKLLKSGTNLQLTGSMRQISLTGSGSPGDLKPVITIPAKEAGSINLETVQVLRVGPAWVGHKWVEDHVSVMPVSIDANGNLVAVDHMIAYSIDPAKSGLGKAGHAQDETQGQKDSEEAWEATSKYLLTSYYKDLNWHRMPLFLRMIPDPENAAGGFRRVASDLEKAELAKKPICNVVILVHGHNEEEKEGTDTPTAEAPWLYPYKQHVWNILYQEVTKKDGEEAIYPCDCTAFYEYIFPTYRPIFSSFTGKSPVPHETLGEALGIHVQQEFYHNTQLRAMVQEDMQFNVVVIAHSQGGLVARAGIRHFPQEVRRNIVRYVSWGTPHNGAALYTLRYALQSGHRLTHNNLPLVGMANQWVIGKTTYYHNRVQDEYDYLLDVHLALDAPGIRDMRWTAARKDLVQLPDVLAGDPSTKRVPILATTWQASMPAQVMSWKPEAIRCLSEIHQSLLR